MYGTPCSDKLVTENWDAALQHREMQQAMEPDMRDVSIKSAMLPHRVTSTMTIENKERKKVYQHFYYAGKEPT